jgi:hypothetical protein
LFFCVVLAALHFSLCGAAENFLLFAWNMQRNVCPLCAPTDNFLFVCVIFAAMRFVFLRVAAENVLYLLGKYIYTFCALCVSAENFLFLGWNLQRFFLCFMRGLYEISIFAWYLQLTFYYLCVVADNFLLFAWYLQLTFLCIFNHCCWLFTVFCGTRKNSFCALCVAAENFLLFRDTFSWSFFWLMRRSWEFFVFVW